MKEKEKKDEAFEDLRAIGMNFCIWKGSFCIITKY